MTSRRRPFSSTRILTSTENTSFCHFSPFYILGPFRFTYFLKSTLWGGRDIVELKKIDCYYTVGESWEISPLPHNESLVVGGPYDGLPLHQLIEQLREKLVGRNNFERFGNRFPLLVKFLSTAADLSIQVHPDNEMAQE